MTITFEEFRRDFPYGILKLPNGEYAPFNRNYYPLGMKKEDDLPADEYYSLFQPPYIPKEIVEKSTEKAESVQKDERGEVLKIYFYLDGSNPYLKKNLWGDYIKRIKDARVW